jgi:hypothetical protein
MGGKLMSKGLNVYQEIISFSIMKVTILMRNLQIDIRCGGSAKAIA